MPSKVFRGSQSSEKTTKAANTFTGDVFVDRIHAEPGKGIANVTFTPCARTYWHTHEGGQLLKVLNGSGWICDKGEKPQRIEAGDTIWAEPGTTHWHGADNGSLLTHLVIGLGKTTWHEEVTEEEYSQKGDGK